MQTGHLKSIWEVIVYLITAQVKMIPSSSMTFSNDHLLGNIITFFVFESNLNFNEENEKLIVERKLTFPCMQPSLARQEFCCCCRYFKIYPNQNWKRVLELVWKSLSAFHLNCFLTFQCKYTNQDQWSRSITNDTRVIFSHSQIKVWTKAIHPFVKRQHLRLILNFLCPHHSLACIYTWNLLIMNI